MAVIHSTCVGQGLSLWGSACGRRGGRYGLVCHFCRRGRGHLDRVVRPRRLPMRRHFHKHARAAMTHTPPTDTVTTTDRTLPHSRRTRRNARSKRYVLLVMFYCRSGAERCLEEVQIAPRCNLLCAAKIAIRHGVMLSGHSTISLPHPALKPYEQRVHIMNEVIVSL